jgi:RNA polymerase sigma-70 factor (sigma-E family)
MASSRVTEGERRVLGRFEEGPYVALVSARWTALHRTAFLLSGNPADADELLQEALAKAYASWAKVSRADDPEAYLHRMLVNEFLSQRRRARWGREKLGLSTRHPAQQSPEAGTVDRLELCGWLHQLPPRQRAVIVLRYYHDWTEAQTAAALGCAVGTVKSQAAAALKTLRTRMTVDPDATEVER